MAEIYYMDHFREKRENVKDLFSKLLEEDSGENGDLLVTPDYVFLGEDKKIKRFRAWLGDGSIKDYGKVTFVNRRSDEKVNCLKIEVLLIPTHNYKNGYSAEIRLNKEHTKNLYAPPMLRDFFTNKTGFYDKDEALRICSLSLQKSEDDFEQFILKGLIKTLSNVSESFVLLVFEEEMHLTCDQNLLFLIYTGFDNIEEYLAHFIGSGWLYGVCTYGDELNYFKEKFREMVSKIVREEVVRLQTEFSELLFNCRTKMLL